MVEEQLYRKFARYYDKIYSKKDYEGEVQFIKWAFEEHKTSEGNKLLDVACGTGSHALLLKDHFSILGVDINPEMLRLAREKVPEVEFQEGDMKKLEELKLDEKFDSITCMFSAINYNTTCDELKITFLNFHKHLNNGGVLIFDLGLNRENWIEGLVSVDTVVEDSLRLARISQSRLENGVFNASFVFLVKKDGELDFDIDQHKLGVFKTLEVKELMEETGFKTFVYDEFTHEEWDGQSGGRPVFVGVK